VKLSIIPKNELSAEQSRYLWARLRAPEHVMDKGPITVWNTYARGLYAVVDNETRLPIGTIEASGPLHQMGAGWWLDARFRGRGIGNETIDALAAYLKSVGVTGIGRIVIDTFGGEHTAASSKLAKRLKSHFPQSRQRRSGREFDRRIPAWTCRCSGFLSVVLPPKHAGADAEENSGWHLSLELSDRLEHRCLGHRITFSQATGVPEKVVHADVRVGESLLLGEDRPP